MLAVIREGAKSWLSQLLIWSVAITFVGAAFFVWGDAQKQTGDVVAIVDDVEISNQRYRDALRRIEDALRSQFGGKMDQTMLDALNPESIALNSVISMELQLKAAKDAGLVVTDAELAGAIENNNDFKVAGSFNKKRYSDLLAMNNQSPAKFESFLRDDLLVEKLKGLVNRSVSISDAQAYARFINDNQSVTVRYARVKPADLESEVEMTESALEIWYKDNISEYMSPEERSFQILRVKNSSFLDKVEASEIEISDYYDSNMDEFEIKESVTVSQILVTEPDKVIAPDKTRTAYEKLEKGADFAEVAKELSDGPMAAEGGDMGKVNRGQMVPEFEEIVFDLEEGAFSKPFLTQFGWHIAKVTKKIEGQYLRLDQVKGTVRNRVIRNNTISAARQFMTNIAQSATAETFASVAETNADVTLSGFVVKKGAVDPSLDIPTEILAELFVSAEKVVSTPVKTENGYALFLVNTITPPAELPLEDVKEAAEEHFREQMAKNNAEKIALDVEKQVNDGNNLQTVATEQGLSITDTPPFSRKSMRDKSQSLDAGMVMEAFDLAKGEAKSVAVNDDYLIITLLERHAIDRKEALAAVPGLKKDLLKRKRMEVYDRFLTGLRKQADADGRVQILAKLN